MLRGGMDGLLVSFSEGLDWVGRIGMADFYLQLAHRYPKAKERLEQLMKGGKQGMLKDRERISRSEKSKHGEDCVIM